MFGKDILGKVCKNFVNYLYELAKLFLDLSTLSEYLSTF